MRLAFAFLLLATMHVLIMLLLGSGLHGFTVLLGVIFASIALGCYGIMRTMVEDFRWRIGLAALLVSVVHLSIALLNIQGVIELRMYGYQIVDHRSLTFAGWTYLMLESVVAGLILLIAISATRALNLSCRARNACST